jgi:phosphate starvation-inducible protein PhoH
MTKKNNTSLTVEALLHNDEFVKAVLAGELEVEAFYDKHFHLLSGSRAVVDEAQRTILSVRQYYESQSLSSETKENLLKKIRSSGRV